MDRLETDRLLLRDITDPDLDALLPIYSQKDNMKFISDGNYHWTREQLSDKYQKCNIKYDIGIGVFVAVLKSSNEIIGEAGLFNSFESLSKLELGYIIDLKYQNKGLGTEIVKGLILYSFQVLHIHKLIARMYSENTASVNLSEKCGMKKINSGRTSSNKTFYEYELINPELLPDNALLLNKSEKATEKQA